MDFFEVYDQYHDRVRKFIAGSVRDDWSADDLTQETFIRVQKNLSSLKDTSKIASWLFRIAHNLCLDHFREIKRNALTGCELSEAKDIFKEAIVQKRLEQSEMSSCVQEVIRTLPESYRSVIMLFDLAELSHSEIAETLNITIENVKVRLHRGHRQLRALLERKCTFELDERNVLVCEPLHESPNDRQSSCKK